MPRYYLAMAGAGLRFVLGPASTDALNRGSAIGYGEVTGISQTVRYFGASLGLAVLGSVFATHGGEGAHLTADGVAQATQTVVWATAGIMVAAFVLARLVMPRDRPVADDAGADAGAEPVRKTATV